MERMHAWVREMEAHLAQRFLHLFAPALLACPQQGAPEEEAYRTQARRPEGLPGAPPRANQQRLRAALRRKWLWRKGYFGRRSGAGLHFVERILTLTL